MSTSSSRSPAGSTRRRPRPTCRSSTSGPRPTRKGSSTRSRRTTPRSRTRSSPQSSAASSTGSRPRPASKRRRRRSTRSSPADVTRRGRNLAGLAFALPALALFALFAIYPMLRVVYLSLFDYNLTSPGRYVGLQNYRFLWHDDRFHASFAASIFFVAAAYVPAVALALLIALGLNSRMRGSGFVRLLY